MSRPSDSVIFADHTFRNSACCCCASSSSLSSRAASMISMRSGSLGFDRFFGIAVGELVA